MILEFEPGDKVINPLNKDWGIGQIQSIINNKITINRILHVVYSTHQSFPSKTIMQRGNRKDKCD